MDLAEIWNSKVIEYLESIISRNWSNVGDSIEIECRLGRLEGNFRSGVDPHFFFSFRDYLSTKGYWVNESGVISKPMEACQFSVSFADSTRVIVEKRGNEYVVLDVRRKKRLESQTFSFGPGHYVLRIAVSEENSTPQSARKQYEIDAVDVVKDPSLISYKGVYVRKRERITFDRGKNRCRIELSKTSSMENVSSFEEYEVECELNQLISANKTETIRKYLQTILIYFFGQGKDVVDPPTSSKFHPNFAQIENESIRKGLLNSRQNSLCTTNSYILNGVIGLRNVEGYDSKLFKLSSRDPKTGEFILARHFASQLKWARTFPDCLFDLDGQPYPCTTEPSERVSVMNLPGVVCVNESKSFDCSAFQYEGMVKLSDLSPLELPRD